MSFPGHRALEKSVFSNMILNNIYFASSLTLSKIFGNKIQRDPKAGDMS